GGTMKTAIASGNFCFTWRAPCTSISSPRSRPARHASTLCWRSMYRAHADRKSTRLNSSHLVNSYAVFCLKKKKNAGTCVQPDRPLHSPVRWLTQSVVDAGKGNVRSDSRDGGLGSQRDNV